MKKFKITQQGKDKCVEYKAINTSIVSIEEKILSMMNNGVGYSSSSIYTSIKKDAALNMPFLTEGSIVNVLESMKNQSYVLSYDDSDIIKINGGETIAY